MQNLKQSECITDGCVVQCKDLEVERVMLYAAVLG